MSYRFKHFRTQGLSDKFHCLEREKIEELKLHEAALSVQNHRFILWG